jgi:CheY-like chemotaxis protein
MARSIHPPSVIVVEDESLIRMLLVDVLTEAGFDVVEASRADEAQDILHANAAEIDVIFTDIHMPGPMNGLDLAGHAQLHWPWISVLVASGKTPPGQVPANSRFIPKPYVLGEVVSKVQKLTACRQPWAHPPKP